MYTLTHEGEGIGFTQFESGDPTELSVSGAFINVGGAKAISGWMKSIGGKEDDGVVFISLNNDFALLNNDGVGIDFAEGHLIAVVADDEVFLEITCRTEDDYKANFSAHMSAMEQ